MVMSDIVTDISTPNSTAHATPEVLDRAREGWDVWRAGRLQAVTAPTGNLALIETRWMAPGDPTPPGGPRAGHRGPVRARELPRRSLETGETERGIRLWDAESPAIRDFKGIDVFPFD